MPEPHRRQKRLNKGLCATCGKNPHVKGKTLCQFCCDRNKKYSKTYTPKDITKSNFKKDKKYVEVYDIKNNQSVFLKDSLVGEKFDKLKVIQYSHQNNKIHHWLCKCDCGNVIDVQQQYLKNKAIEHKSCNYCYNSASDLSLKSLKWSDDKRKSMGYYEFLDKNTQELVYVKHNLKGKQFGDLEVLDFHHKESNKKYWLCNCSCGKEKIVFENNLLTGKSKSCGCSTVIKNGNIIRVVDQLTGEEHIIREDLAGIKLGNYDILSFHHKKRNQNYWLCKNKKSELKVIRQGDLRTAERRLKNKIENS